MKYKLFLLSRIVSGFLFCALFFMGLIGFYCSLNYILIYVVSLIFAFVYLFSSFLTFRYQRRYFFEFKKTIILRSVLIILMYAAAIILNSTFVLVVNLESIRLLIFYFFLIYVGFYLFSDLSTLATSYRMPYDHVAYRNKALKVIKYIEQQNSIGNKIEDKIGSEKRASMGSSFFTNHNFCVYDFFADHEGELIAFYETDFYEELMEFSKQNQIFYGKTIEDENYILDSRCNKVCITSGNFSFYDYYGKKCIFTMKFYIDIFKKYDQYY